MKNKKKQRNKEEKKPIDFKYNFGMYWKLVKKYKWTAVLILLLILFFQSSYSAESFVFKYLTDEGANYLAGKTALEIFANALFWIAAAFITIKVLQTIFRWVWMSAINKIETDMMLDLKREMFNHVVHLDHEFHTSNKTGSLISKLIRGGNAVERLSDVLLFNFIPLLFQTIVVGGTILLFDWVSSVVVLGTIIVFAVFSLYINRLQQPANMNANDAEDMEKAIVSDFLLNIESIKYFGKEERIKKKYFGFANTTRKTMLKHYNYFRTLSSGHTFILGAGVFFLIFFPMQKLLAGTMTIGTIVFIYTSFGTMIGHLYGFDHGLRGFYRAMADFESLFRYCE